jgi:hypothetical protein
MHGIRRIGDVTLVHAELCGAMERGIIYWKIYWKENLKENLLERGYSDIPVCTNKFCSPLPFLLDSL